jgi:hypothetical protein
MTMTDAEKLFFAGAAHARAAHMLVAAAEANIHMSVPFYLLLGFSLETILKAAYIHHGGKIKTAKKNIGHDLTKAFNQAINQGFKPGNKHLKWLTKTMTDVHRNHSFRYLTGEGELRVPVETCAMVIVDDLVVQVGQLLHPQHDRLYWIERLTKYDARRTSEEV